MEIGTKISEALAMIGLTEGSIERWLGRPCGCRERADKLDALGAWASRVLAGRVEKARHWLEQLTGKGQV